jgi:hypothetical protein
MYSNYFGRSSIEASRYVRYYVQRESRLGSFTIVIPVPARASNLLDFEFGSPMNIRCSATRVVTSQADLTEVSLSENVVRQAMCLGFI